MSELEVAPKKRRSNRCAAFVADRKGATAVEFALVGAPFLALIIALRSPYALYCQCVHF